MCIDLSAPSWRLYHRVSSHTATRVYISDQVPWFIPPFGFTKQSNSHTPMEKNLYQYCQILTNIAFKSMDKGSNLEPWQRNQPHQILQRHGWIIYCRTFRFYRNGKKGPAPKTCCTMQYCIVFVSFKTLYFRHDKCLVSNAKQFGLVLSCLCVQAL